MREMTEFSGGVFHSSLADGRAAAEIQVTSVGLVARTTDDQVFEIPFSESQLDVGGASGHMVFCRTHDRQLTIFCEHKEFPAALELQSVGEVSDELATLFRRRRQEAHHWRMWMLATAAVLAIGLIGGYYTLMAVAKASVQALPISVDQKIGKLALEAMDFDGPAVNDPIVVDAVKKIIARLEPHTGLAGLAFEVRVIDSAAVNAFCLPGGKVIVNTGLLKLAQSPEQVAGVLSHEMAHAVKRHGLQRVTESLGIVVAIELMVGDVGGLLALGVELGKTAALTSYSREHETEADLVGVRLLHAAAIDPLELANFFEMLKKQDGELPAAIAWISTHPQHDVRIAAIRGQLENLGPREYRDLDIDWEEVQQHLKPLQGK